MERQRGWNLPPGPSVSPMSQPTVVPTGSHTRLGQSLLIDLRNPGENPRESLHQLGGGSVGSWDWWPDVKACRWMWGDRG